MNQVTASASTRNLSVQVANLFCLAGSDTCIGLARSLGMDYMQVSGASSLQLHEIWSFEQG